MGFQERALPAVARVGSVWKEASAQKRGRPAPQARTTPQHTDATPPEPLRVARSSPPMRYCVRLATAAFTIPFHSKSISGYDDVNHSSYSPSVRKSYAARYNNHR